MRIRAAASFAAICLLAGLVLVDFAYADLVPVGGVVATHDHRCGSKDLPETGLQGDVPMADQRSGRAEQGYNCGLAVVGHATLNANGRSPTNNANMAWAKDCAYVSGPGAFFGSREPEPTDGVAVIDVSDPTRPRHVRTLRTAGAEQAIETIYALDTPKRSLLVIGQYGNVSGGNKPMDVYDVSTCTKPKLLQTFRFPKNIHNLTITGNGRYVFATQPLQVVDLAPLFDNDKRTGLKYLGDIEEATPGLPFTIGPVADIDDSIPKGDMRNPYLSHEAWPTYDGTKVYVGGQLPTFETVSILDLRAWLKRDKNGYPSGPPKIISQRSGRGHSVRTATIDGRRYLLHSEESILLPTWGCIPETFTPFAGPAQPWLTDITDERDPRFVSQFGLEINEPENCASAVVSNLRASVHYHDVDDPKDTTFVMASMWNAGLRVFDVREPTRPVEVAYFNPGDANPGDNSNLDNAWGHSRWVPQTGHIWFATAKGGFWVVEMEPQVRRQLGLDGGGRSTVPVRYPKGRPGRVGITLSVGTLSEEFTPLSCAINRF